MMIKTLVRIGLLGVVSATLGGWPAPLLAQTNEPPTNAVPHKATKKEPGENSRRAIPFRGVLGAVDKTAKTISVGERTFQITSETRIFKGGKPALLESGVLGEPITGSYRKAADGKLMAASVYFGGRGEPKKSEAKKAEKAPAN
jgi:hypothetical protein